jgi:NagD protein
MEIDLLSGTAEFIQWLKREGKKFLFLTQLSGVPQWSCNRNSNVSASRSKVSISLRVPSRLPFLVDAHPGGSAYVIGEPGLINALYNVGYK